MKRRRKTEIEPDFSTFPLIPIREGRRREGEGKIIERRERLVRQRKNKRKIQFHS